jgi:hypothetical protein
MNIHLACALLIVAFLTACAPEPPSAAPIPTVMALPTLTPSEVPTRTPRPTLTFTLPPSDTPIPATATPDLVQTQFAALDATNAAAQSTLSALQTQLAEATTAPPSAAPTQAITAAPPTIPASPSATPDPIVAMPPSTLYARDVAPLHACPERTCAPLHLLSPGAALAINGSLSGDMIQQGNNLWYRAEWSGQVVYVYSGYLTAVPPTPIQLVQPSQPEATPPVLPPAQNMCPRNCTEAVAWGYTAEQAAACGLDRDGDGVACYGD